MTSWCLDYLVAFFDLDLQRPPRAYCYAEYVGRTTTACKNVVWTLQKGWKTSWCRTSERGDKNIASVYLDGQFIASASSEHKENAKLQVAKAALKELFYNPFDKMDVEFVPFQRKKRDSESITFQKKKMDVEFDPTKECEGAKQKLNGLCQIEKWPKPTYRLVFFFWV